MIKLIFVMACRQIFFSEKMNGLLLHCKKTDLKEALNLTKWDIIFAFMDAAFLFFPTLTARRLDDNIKIDNQNDNQKENEYKNCETVRNGNAFY
ncbi:MAG: hypothetical protein EOM28_02280 [Clostridia bacterium]|nr:hypothetical protein [Clostridia bacterium]